MACGMCGPATPPKNRWQVILDNDGEEEEHLFLTKTEARMYAMTNGGGRISRVE